MTVETNKNSQIEALRAVAILYTLIHHLPIVIGHVPEFSLPIYLNASFHIGVDLFFVISGFVITRSLCSSEVEKKVPRWRLMVAFWLKRAFRLLPLAWLGLLVAAMYIVTTTYLLGGEDQVRLLLVPVLAGFLQVENLYLSYCFSHLGKGVACGASNFTAHYWSLSLEEQFYMLYPFLFFLVNRKLLVILLCIAIVVQLFWLRPLGSHGWYFRTDGLSWGVLLGFFSNTRAYAASRTWLLPRRHLLVAVMLLLIILLPILASRVEGFGANAKTYGVGAVAFVSAVIVLIASYDFKIFGNAGAIHKALLYLGARSYSLYVTHFLTFQIIGIASSSILAGRNMGIGVSAAYYTFLFVLSLLSTVGASELSYRYVESRYRPKGRELARQFLSK